MPRIRTIKPEFPQSESMGRVSRAARLLFILLWTLADDSGRLRGDSRMLASVLYPYDTDAKKLLPKWLAELEQEKCVVSYVFEDSQYLQVLNWSAHQKIDRPTKSKIPPFDEISTNVRESSRGLDEDSSGDLRIKDQGSKDQGSGSRNGREKSRPIETPLETVFERQKSKDIAALLPGFSNLVSTLKS